MKVKGSCAAHVGKSSPGEEGQMYSQCLPWKRSRVLPATLLLTCLPQFLGPLGPIAQASVGIFVMWYDCCSLYQRWIFFKV